MDEKDSWTKKEGDIVIIGMKENAKKAKEFVFISLPKKGASIKKGETYVSLESIKWSGHLPSPVSGKIIEVNEKLFDDPSLLNKDPKSNWIMKVKVE